MTIIMNKFISISSAGEIFTIHNFFAAILQSHDEYVRRWEVAHFAHLKSGIS